MIFEEVFDGYKVTLNSETEIKIINESKEKSIITFYNKECSYHGYTNSNFFHNHWVITDFKKWTNCNNKNIYYIDIISESKKITLEYNLIEKKITNKSDKFCLIENFKQKQKNISILIPVYRNYLLLDETLNTFIDILDKKNHLIVEIIIGIDGCEETLRHVSKKVYPDFVKIFFSEKNYGLSIIKNTLIQNSSNEKCILFDSDDIPTINLIDIVYNSLDETDFVFYKNLSFIDGTDYTKKENLITPKDNNFLGGTFGMNRSKFLSMCGFFPWRVQSDDEFKHRLANKKINFKVIDNFLFYYRIRNNSLSRNRKTNQYSLIRQVYRSLMGEKIQTNTFENPNLFKFNKDIIWIQ